MHRLIQQTKPKPNVASRTPQGNGRRMRAFPSFEASSDYEDYASGESLVAAIEEKHAVEDETLRMSTLEGRIDAVVTCLGQQGLLREALYKILAHCDKPETFEEVEQYAQSLPEVRFGHLLQTPFNLIEMLVKAGALEKQPVDATGAVVTEARLEGLSEDEADDLVETWVMTASEAGRGAVELLHPSRRIAATLATKPHRAATYLAVMDFCRSPKTFDQINRLFANDKSLVLDMVDAHQRLSPDFYVDKLEKAGAIVWQNAWITTPEGLDTLEAAHREPRIA